MLEHLISIILPTIIHILEFMGIIVISLSGAKAFYQYLLGFFTKQNYRVKYEFANSLAMALEFKLAAEILKTVLIRNLDEIIILASIIILRALLSLIIHAEIKADHHSASSTTVQKDTVNDKVEVS